MKNNDAPDALKHCPECGAHSSSVVDSIFVEYGEWNEDSYDAEGDVDVYRCSDAMCGFEFADVCGILQREKPEWTSLQNLTPI